MKIYMTRHGETLWNKEGRMQGRMNSNLSDLGENQARQLGKSLQNYDIKRIVTSSAGRAIQTTGIINDFLNLPVIVRDDLQEMYLGKWEGVDREVIEIEENYYNFFHKPELFIADEKESYEEIIERVAFAIEEIIAYDEDVLIVAHGVVLKAIIAYIENKCIKDFWKGAFMKSTCLNILDVSNRTFVKKGDTSHLA